MMIEIINSHNQERLNEKLTSVRERSIAFDADLMRTVGAIVNDVRVRGDEALIEYSARFDGCVMELSELRIGEEELRRIASQVEVNVQEARREAISNIRRFQEHEQQHSWEIGTEHGVRLGQRITAIEHVGLYVP